MAIVKDIMTEEVITVKGSATVAEAVLLMKYEGVHSLVIERCTPDDAYGIVTSADIANKIAARGRDPKITNVSEIMTKPCLVVSPDLAIEYVAQLFSWFGIDHAPVVEGDLLGVISHTDILFKGNMVENPRVPLLQKALEKAIARARAASAAEGPNAKASCEAWEEANEIEAELAFIQGIFPEKSAAELFGDKTPTEEPAVL